MDKPEYTYEIIRKILGEISPQGESNTDAERLENLYTTIYVVNQLMTDIIGVSENKDRWEASMKRAGLLAHEFITDIKANLSYDDN